MTVFDDLETANRAYADAGDHADPGAPPARALAVITCMDARIDVPALFGIAAGDAHVIRTAGGRVTPDVLRSLTLSTHLLGVRDVAVITHTRCGLHDPDGRTPTLLEERLGHRPAPRDWYTFADPGEAAREDVQVLLAWEERPADLTVAGYVLDIGDGRLSRVVAPTEAAPPS